MLSVSKICLVGNYFVFLVSELCPLRSNGLKLTLDLTLESVFDQLRVPLLSALCACLRRFSLFFWFVLKDSRLLFRETR